MHVCNTVEKSYGINEHIQWCIDSGCMTHLCREKEMFESITPADDKVSLVNDASAKKKGKGAVSVRSSKGKAVRFKETLHMSELRNNLLSVSKITDAGNPVNF